MADPDLVKVSESNSVVADEDGRYLGLRVVAYVAGFLAMLYGDWVAAQWVYEGAKGQLDNVTQLYMSFVVAFGIGGNATYVYASDYIIPEVMTDTYDRPGKQDEIVSNPGPVQVEAPAQDSQAGATVDESVLPGASFSQRHTAFADAWADMICDPLNALTHSALFDVTQARTAAWVEAYGELADTFGEPDTRYEDDPQYRRMVGKAERAWEQARRYAEHMSYRWLPQDQAKRARQAETLLRTASDETATLHERSLAAAKAAELLQNVTAFILPAPASATIEHVIRQQITSTSLTR